MKTKMLGLILLAGAGLIFLLSFNWLLILLVVLGLYLYLKGGE